DPGPSGIPESSREGLRRCLAGPIQGGGALAQAAGNRRHMDAAQPTRVDEVEEPQVRSDVERESMIAHPAPHRDSNRRNLFILAPDAGAPRRALGGDAPALECLDQAGFDVPEEAVEVAAALGQIADEVADELTRPVPGDVSAPRHLEELDAHPPQRLGI